MGNDAALAAMSNRPRQPYEYFKQLFAQVRGSSGAGQGFQGLLRGSSGAGQGSQGLRVRGSEG
jgi:hypothetical protein